MFRISAEMKLLAVLFAVLVVVVMTAIPVFGNIPQCPPTDDVAQGGSYPITELMRNGRRPPVYNTGRNGK
ncbi:uncharacterized protein LOC119547438 [Drosophila subpulchrella]|uniref:uncharacterized protein LOC119547438 n=1 Tax=Drosophila subpulchrella TaxID=1486046 RepID=UPI0007E40D6A|nr:uncharacterized protein LOC108012874 [Drosophila suzukii]XP_037710227.1 uncharacterized protein LOC119547438 [Drosophila subpulchrella]